MFLRPAPKAERTASSCLHAVSYPDAIFPNQEEVSNNGKDYVLQRDSDSRGEQARECRHRGKLGGKGQHIGISVSRLFCQAAHDHSLYLRAEL